MFGPISPTVKNLLTQANTWQQLQTFTKSALGTTTGTSNILINPTPAALGAQQASPAFVWRGNGWRTGTSVSQTVDFRVHVLPVQGTAAALGDWKLQSSIAGGAYEDGLTYSSRQSDGLTFGRLQVAGSIKATMANSSTIDTLQNFDMVSTGTRVSLTATFTSTIRWGIQVQDSGYTVYKAAGSQAFHNFEVGTTIGSTALIAQIYSQGIYNAGGSFNQGRVTAGGANTSPPAFLTTYGSLGLKGVLYTSSIVSITDNETMVYCDASNAFICSGTPSACSTYTGAGQATCETHTGVGCSWFAGNDCSAFNGTNESECETGHVGCTYDESTCSAANNTDSSTCEAQDDSFGGNCAWDTSTCPGFTNTAACNGQTGCTATVDGDCTTLSDGGGDGTNCATQPECSYNSGDGVCSGTFFTACVGSLCTGNYFNGTCSGVYNAACVGTALCNNLTPSGSGTCAAESGCSWVSGMVVTLPSSSVANQSNTSRLYSVVNIGASGTVTVIPFPGGATPDSILGYGSGVVLNAQNERGMFHHHNVISNCSGFGTQTPCEAAGTCTWNLEVVCSAFDGDESNCNNNSGCGCTYAVGLCTGAGCAANCSGTYTSSKPWVIHQLSN